MPQRKVAILGGGVGAMTAAWSLTNYDGWQADWDITVYQMGWRLGGKGASGRNCDIAQRIEEHGLHMWMGFYHNAFAMIQQAYAECLRDGLTPGSPMKDWREAFHPQSSISIAEQLDPGWNVWTQNWPIDPNGDPAVCPFEKEPWHFVLDVLRWLVERWEQAPHFGVKLTAAEDSANWQIAPSIKDRIEAHLIPAAPSACDTLLHMALRVAESIPADALKACESLIEALLHLIQEFARCAFQALEREVEQSDFYRRLRTSLDFFLPVAKGLIADDVINKGFDSIDGSTLVDFVVGHGGDSGNDLLRSFPDSAFAYEKGDPARPNWAAGTALRAIFRLSFDRPGALAWKMQGGMGDIVFTPLYKVLQHRGVHFEFFHKITDVLPTTDGSAVGEIQLKRQVELLQPYDPLYPVNGLLCWPDRPLWKQIKNGAELEKSGINLESYWPANDIGTPVTLQAGRDFDVVVMGISLGALPFAAGGLVNANKKWQDMVKHVQTIPTQAFQLWMTESASDLGWSGDAGDEYAAMISGYVEPHDTYADMSHLIPRECWPTPLGQIAYFCNAMPDAGIPLDDPGFPQRQTDAAYQAALDFVTGESAFYWPKFLDAHGAPRWDVLSDLGSGTGEQRFKAQFFRANYEPSERFVLSLAESLPYRIPSGDSGYSNLVLAGDWTRNGLNTGCVEAAVMSGMQASRALCGHPAHIIGETDFPSAAAVSGAR